MIVRPSLAIPSSVEAVTSPEALASQHRPRLLTYKSAKLGSTICSPDSLLQLVKVHVTVFVLLPQAVTVLTTSGGKDSVV